MQDPVRAALTCIKMYMETIDPLDFEGKLRLLEDAKVKKKAEKIRKLILYCSDISTRVSPLNHPPSLGSEQYYLIQKFPNTRK